MATLSDFEIEVRSKRFAAVGQAGAHEAIRNLRVTARHGEFICLVGPSGCGKTTLLNIIAGLERDYEGRLRLPKIDGGGAPVIGYVFQTPRLLPWRTITENLELVLTPAQRASSVIDDLLRATGLQDFRHSYPEHLSVGMRRRVSLARAFAVQPDLLLMDEPFVSLDESTAERLRYLLLDIWRDRPTTVLFVTHDLREAILLGDRIVLLSEAPTSVRADLRVDLGREARRDPAKIEAFRARLIREHPQARRDLDGGSMA